jgi:hypothetical protein
MLRSRWSDRRLPSSLRHPSGIVTLVEFMSLLDTDSEMQTWFKPVIATLEQLERRTDAAQFRDDGHRHRRSKKVIAPRDRARTFVGARPYFLQCALQDLVDFLVRTRSHFLPNHYVWLPCSVCFSRYPHVLWPVPNVFLSPSDF